MVKKKKKKKKNKRKNSSEGDSAKTSKSNKEAKTGFNIATPEGVGGFLSNIPLQSQYSPGLPGSPINMTTLNNSVFGTGTAGSPLSQQMQGQMLGAMGYMGSGVGYHNPPGMYSGVPPSFNMANLLPTAQSSPHPGQPCIGGQSGTNPAAGMNA